MSSQSRLRSLERRLGIDGGPMIECPSCEGAGARYAVDGPRMIWRVQQAIDIVVAEYNGQSKPEPTEPPDEEPGLCYVCRGAGRISQSRHGQICDGSAARKLDQQVAMMNLY